MKENAFIPYDSLGRPDGQMNLPEPGVPRRKVIRGGEAIISREEVPVGRHKSHGPTLHVDKKDGVIRSIEVLCTCGQKVTILCQYD